LLLKSLSSKIRVGVTVIPAQAHRVVMARLRIPR